MTPAPIARYRPNAAATRLGRLARSVLAVPLCAVAVLSYACGSGDGAKPVPPTAGAQASPSAPATVQTLAPISGAGARGSSRLNMEACAPSVAPAAPRTDLRCGDKVTIAAAACLDLRHYPTAVDGVGSDGKRYFGTRITSLCPRDGTLTLGSDPVFTEGAIWLNLFLNPQVNGWAAAGANAQDVKLVERGRSLPFQLPCQGTRAPEGFACDDRVRVSAAAPGACLELRHYPTTLVGASEGKQYFGVLVSKDVFCKGAIEGVVATDPYGGGNDFWLNVKINEQLEGWVNTGPAGRRHVERIP